MRRGERGAVTAELALGLPVLAALTVGLVWLLVVAMAQVRAVDAARETARAVVRGDEVSHAVELGRVVAPPGAVVEVTRAGDRARVRVTGRVEGPGGVFGRAGATYDAEAVALVEE